MSVKKDEVIENTKVNANSGKKKSRIICFGMVVLVFTLAFSGFIYFSHIGGSRKDARSLYTGKGEKYFSKEYIEANKTKDINELDNPNLKADTCLSPIKDGLYDEFSRYLGKLNELIDIDVEKLYDYIDSDKLAEAGYIYPYENFKAYIDGIIQYTGDRKSKRQLFLTDCSNMDDYYICNVVFIKPLTGSKNNVLYDYDNSIEQEITIYVDKSGKAKFLPFNILDISVCADVYGLMEISGH